ncbi:helix-turn-helix domain-containing protein [Streptomyces sp. NPDC059816]|uniref:helix-turn-helix domain-containing protein n=1 Tax=Streptomyces sp. NPDC059816 TaxID=3346960 RepID=UPI0036547254
MTDQRNELNANDALRHARTIRGWTQDQTARKVRTWLTDHDRPAAPGFDAQTVSRLERGVIRWPRSDIRAALRAVFDTNTDTALGLSPRRARASRTPTTSAPGRPQLQSATTVPAHTWTPTPRLDRIGREDGEDSLRRRKLLAGLAATATSTPLTGTGTAHAGEAQLGELIVTRVRDALLGPAPAPTSPPAPALAADLTRARADFDSCRYAALAVRLPRLIHTIRALSTLTTPDHCTLLAEAYLLVTRTLVKQDSIQLGWLAADRARQFAEAGGNVLTIAEAAGQTSVLARKSGWHREALSIALTAADHPGLRTAGRAGTAAKGRLIQNASYTLARRGDRDGMRALTDEAAAIAHELGDTALLRDHGGGFTPLTVQLHRVSAEVHAGDPLTALAAASAIPLDALPSLERRSRALGDIALTYDSLGRRTDCLNALLGAERLAPQETHARPATKSLIVNLLASGPTSTELRGLAERSGVD